MGQHAFSVEFAEQRSAGVLSHWACWGAEYVSNWVCLGAEQVGFLRDLGNSVLQVYGQGVRACSEEQFTHNSLGIAKP